MGKPTWGNAHVGRVVFVFDGSVGKDSKGIKVSRSTRKISTFKMGQGSKTLPFVYLNAWSLGFSCSL